MLILGSTTFLSYFWTIYFEYSETLSNEYTLFVLEVFFKYNNSSLVFYFLFASLLFFVLRRLVKGLGRVFYVSDVPPKMRQRHVVDSILFYVFINLWRLSFSDYAAFYEYNYLDLFSEVFLLYLFLFFSESMKPIERFWIKVTYFFRIVYLHFNISSFPL